MRQPTQRLFSVFIAALFVTTLAAQLLPSLASASGPSGGQVQSRSITMSSSYPGQTNVTYTVEFTPVTSETHPDVIIDFCNASSDPIAGDTCSGTAGTDVPNFSSAAASGWTVTPIDSNHDIKLTTTTNSFTGGGSPVAITPIVITGVTNPSNTTGFYGRILTYANGGSSGYSSPTSLGSPVDFGGIALSTASSISITSKVFETLSFCVFQSTCGTAPNLILGDATTGALSTGTGYVNANAQYTIATNASSGVNVTMTGSTLCRPGGTCATGANAYTISAIGNTPAASTPGSPQFGMCVDSNSLPSGVSVAGAYTDTTSTKCHGLTTGTYALTGGSSSTFGFNDSSSSGGTNNAAGSQVLSSTGAIASYTGTFAFLGNISVTTVAGIYTTSLNMVATGTF